MSREIKLTKIGLSVSTPISLDPDLLAAPGTVNHIQIEPVSRNDESPPTVKQQQSQGQFLCKAGVSKGPRDLSDFNAQMDPKHGSSFLSLPHGTASLRLRTDFGEFILETNEHREVSVISHQMMATDHASASNDFVSRLNILLDSLSYEYSVPFFTTVVVVMDLANSFIHVTFQSPPTRAMLNSDFSGGVFEEMQPVIAFYREAQNSHSPYYRVLCYSKIIEGLRGKLAREFQTKAKMLGLQATSDKAIVPFHPDIPASMKSYVGKSVEDFWKGFLEKQYRDAVAHFDLSRHLNATLNVSEAEEFERFTGVSFVAELCARVMIERHRKRLELIERTLRT